MLANNPRYEKVLNHAGDASAFAHGLQRAGYRNRPAEYGAKLRRAPSPPRSALQRSLA